MDSLSQRALSHIRRQELLGAGDRVGVAVSGGIDSVALLRLLLELRGELGIVVSVVHFNHRLRGAESDGDQEFVAGLAREFGVEFYCDGDDTARFAAEEQCSIETAARELRYGFFHRLLGAGEPQGLKPSSLTELSGASELVPFPSVGNSVPSSQFPENPANFVNTICTGHTLDDQAETVLMRVIRGTGMRGLGAIHPRLAVEDDSGEVCGEIVRPLLGFRRTELEGYLREIGQKWREDSSNSDDRFTRNRVRHALLPLIEREFNPSVAENLSELAEIARGEEDYWENEAAGWMGRTVLWFEPEWVLGRSKSKSLTQSNTGDLAGEHRVDLRGQDLVQIFAASDPSEFDSELEARINSVSWVVVNGSVNLLWLLGEPIALQRRLIKAMGEYVRLPLEFKHVEEILRFAAEEGEAGKELSLPLGWKIVRSQEILELVTPDLRRQGRGHAEDEYDYEYDLPVPGCVVVKETRSSFITSSTTASISSNSSVMSDSGILLDAGGLTRPLRVRNWRAGDRFWPAHTKSPKKIKELLQGRAANEAERKLWPVIVSGDVIVWVRGFAVPAKFEAKAGREAVLIEERKLADGGNDIQK